MDKTFSVRMNGETVQIIEQLAEELGVTKRAIVEEAVGDSANRHAS